MLKKVVLVFAQGPISASFFRHVEASQFEGKPILLATVGALCVRILLLPQLAKGLSCDLKDLLFSSSLMVDQPW